MPNGLIRAHKTYKLERRRITLFTDRDCYSEYGRREGNAVDRLEAGDVVKFNLSVE